MTQTVMPSVNSDLYNTSKRQGSEGGTKTNKRRVRLTLLDGLSETGDHREFDTSWDVFLALATDTKTNRAHIVGQLIRARSEATASCPKPWCRMSRGRCRPSHSVTFCHILSHRSCNGTDLVDTDFAITNVYYIINVIMKFIQFSEEANSAR